MQNPMKLVDAINRLNNCTNFLAREVIDTRNQIDATQTRLTEQEWQAIRERLIAVGRVLERIGNDPNDPALKDLPTE